MDFLSSSSLPRSEQRQPLDVDITLVGISVCEHKWKLCAKRICRGRCSARLQQRLSVRLLLVIVPPHM